MVALVSCRRKFLSKPTTALKLRVYSSILTAQTPQNPPHNYESLTAHRLPPPLISKQTYIQRRSPREKETTTRGGKLVINDTGITSSASFLRGFAKVEPLTIAELCQFIITTEPQAHLRPLIFTHIKEENVWCYISCSKCAKKLQRSASLFACMFCNQTNVVGVLRYCLEMTVVDDSDEAVFVKFLCEITKLTNIWAADAGHLLDYDC
ncbi:hypothetical protein N665_0106s0011 [Sinapis alba]|nr:hypothetical protein N665_0106s0011 [Sinapis alba]